MTNINNHSSKNRWEPVETLAVANSRVLPGERQQDALKLLEGGAGW